MADRAPASMVSVAGHDQMMVPHCPGYGTRIQGDCFSTSVWSVRQYICVVAELLSYTPADVMMTPARATT